MADQEKGNKATGKTADKTKKKKATGTRTAKTAGTGRKRDKARPGKPGPSHIVGIGASAGGLEALEQLFDAMPADSGMGFVLVPHLDPTHKSIFHEILQKRTTMEVRQIEDGMRVEPDHVYVIPPDRDLALFRGTLQLVEPTERRGLRHPIDFFFRSLAADQGEKAVCIVLSGTGTEGTLGLKAVKGEGGLVGVQEPTSAKYDGMPQSAMATGLADFVLPPAEIPGQLLAIVARLRGKMPLVPGKQEQAPPLELAGDDLKKIFLFIRNRTGHDFSQYKPNTIRRRIERRLAVHQIEDTAHYARYLMSSPREIDLLFKELLIRVTNFFRDPAAFELLKGTVLPAVVDRKISQVPLRFWVPGCSTGEEAYSLAIAAHEYLTESNLDRKVLVYATDIDIEAVETARTGIYPESISVDVTPLRLRRYFTRESNAYKVSKALREMVVFAEQDLIKDPPFSKIDLISCRNLLIYLGPTLQAKLIPIFHYALNPGGMLFLGSSETIGSFTDLFAPFDAKWKFFKPLPASLSKHELHFPPALPAAREPPGPEKGAVPPGPSLDEVSRGLLLTLYAPACAIIDSDGTILHFHGRTGKFLEPPPGRATLNIFAMAREGLKTELRTAVRTVQLGKEEAFLPGLMVRTNGGLSPCNLRVRRIDRPEHLKGLIVVIFEDNPAGEREDDKTPGKEAAGGKKRVAELELELRRVNEQLQTTVEELEASNEELQSTNEELQSANEELQSTNEEIETSKEELQSVNEELMTVNAESQNKIDQLTRASEDMTNLLAAIDIATVFLDTKLRIKRFTPAAVRVFKVIQTDIGRPISDIAFILQYDHLVEDIRQVLTTLVPHEQQVLDRNGLWYLIRILPYRTLSNVIDGVVLTFVDISEQKKTERSLLESEERCLAILDQAREGIALVDYESGAITDINRRLRQQLQWQDSDLRSHALWDLVRPEAVEAAKEMLAAIRSQGEEEERELELCLPDGTSVRAALSGRVVNIGGRKHIQCFFRLLAPQEKSGSEKP